MKEGSSSIPVYLNIYDFTNLNNCLSAVGVGGYHTGVQLKGLQFCYFVCESDETKTGVIAIEPQTADFSFNSKLYMGETYLTGDQLENLIDELASKYQNGKYHVFKNNCNHFSDQLVQRLVGARIPKWIFRSTNILSLLCCCLPQGLVSGKWAIQMIQRQVRKEQQAAKNKFQIQQKLETQRE